MKHVFNFFGQWGVINRKTFGNAKQKEQTRKLAAIMFTDIAGFTKKMSFDENVAISSVINPCP